MPFSHSVEKLFRMCKRSFDLEKTVTQGKITVDIIPGSLDLHPAVDGSAELILM